MSSERVRNRQEQRKKKKNPGSGASSPWFWAAIGAIVALFVLAFFLTKGDEPAGDTGGETAGIQETGPVEVSGDALPAFEDPSNDASVGQQAPVLTGETFEGDPIEIGTPGRPTVVVFLAHWCPHCQIEVPRVKTFIDEGNVPGGIDITSVATSTSDTQANYPPSAWLEGEGWQPPVMVDEAEGKAADAYGLTSFPYFVFLNSDGTVNARISGEVAMDTLADMLAALE